MKWTIDCADILNWCKAYDGEKFHAVLCDPPYHLTSPSSHSGTQPNNGVYGRINGGSKGQSGGFMGKRWDGGSVAFQPETWAAITEHLYPGAFGMSFASSRGWHRLACAIEDAGLIIHPSIFMLGWVQGQGFPKATRIKVNGEEPEEWSGHRYGLQVMKPSLEPIILFQKPYRGKPTDCITSTGAGALWIDGCRVATGEDLQRVQNPTALGQGSGWNSHDNKIGETFGSTNGRWPPNVVLSHLPGCERVGVKQIRYRGGKPNQEEGHTYTYGWANCSIFKKGHIPANPDGTETVDDWVCVEGCPVAELSAQSGERPNGYRPNTCKINVKSFSCYGKESRTKRGRRGHNDKGTAARFYPQFGWQYEIAERLAGVVPFKYQAKSSRSERDAGLEEFKERQGRTMGHGLTGISGDRSGNGKQEPLPMGEGKIRNHHPTVKPIELCKWLCSLLAPPPEYAPRRLLIPFAGSGSEMCAAVLSGQWEGIIGVEMEPDYMAIAQARLAYWSERVQLELAL